MALSFSLFFLSFRSLWAAWLAWGAPCCLASVSLGLLLTATSEVEVLATSPEPLWVASPPANAALMLSFGEALGGLGSDCCVTVPATATLRLFALSLPATGLLLLPSPMAPAPARAAVTCPEPDLLAATLKVPDAVPDAVPTATAAPSPTVAPAIATSVFVSDADPLANSVDLIFEVDTLGVAVGEY